MSQTGPFIQTGGGGTGPLFSLSDNAGTKVFGDASGNIQTFGGSGITTLSNPGSNQMIFNLNNYSNLTTTTTDATPNNTMTIALGTTPGVYTFDINIAAFDATDISGGGYSIFGTARTDGATATLVGTPDRISNEETAMIAANSALTVSGNNAVIQVTGIAATTIRWRAITFYTFVS